MADFESEKGLLQKHMVSMDITPSGDFRKDVGLMVGKIVGLLNVSADTEAQKISFNPGDEITDDLITAFVEGAKALEKNHLVAVAKPTYELEGVPAKLKTMAINTLSAALTAHEQAAFIPDAIKKNPVLLFDLLNDREAFAGALRTARDNNFFAEPAPEAEPEPTTTVDPDLEVVLAWTPLYSESIKKSGDINEATLKEAADNFVKLVRAADPTNPIKNYDSNKTFVEQFGKSLESETLSALDHFIQSPVYQTLVTLRDLPNVAEPNVAEDVKIQAMREFLTSGRTKDAMRSGYIEDPRLLFLLTGEAKNLFQGIDDLRASNFAAVTAAPDIPSPRAEIKGPDRLAENDPKVLLAKGVTLGLLASKAKPGRITLEEINGTPNDNIKAVVNEIIGEIKPLVKAYAIANTGDDIVYDDGTEDQNYTSEIGRKMLAVITHDDLPNKSRQALEKRLGPLGGIAGTSKVVDTVNTLVESGKLNLEVGAPTPEAKVSDQPSSSRAAGKAAARRDAESRAEGATQAPNSGVSGEADQAESSTGVVKLNPAQQEAHFRLSLVLAMLRSQKVIKTDPKEFKEAVKEALIELPKNEAFKETGLKAPENGVYTKAFGQDLIKAYEQGYKALKDGDKNKENLDTLLVPYGGDIKKMVADLDMLKAASALDKKVDVPATDAPLAFHVAVVETALNKLYHSGEMPGMPRPGEANKDLTKNVFEAASKVALPHAIEGLKVALLAEGEGKDKYGGPYDGTWVKDYTRVYIKEAIDKLPEKKKAAFYKQFGGEENMNRLFDALDELSDPGHLGKYIDNTKGAEIKADDALVMVLKLSEWLPDSAKSWIGSFLKGSEFDQFIAAMIELFLGIPLSKLLGTDKDGKRHFEHEEGMNTNARLETVYKEALAKAGGDTAKMKSEILKVLHTKGEGNAFVEFFSKFGRVRERLERAVTKALDIAAKEELKAEGSGAKFFVGAMNEAASFYRSGAFGKDATPPAEEVNQKQGSGAPAASASQASSDGDTSGAVASAAVLQGGQGEDVAKVQTVSYGAGGIGRTAGALTGAFEGKVEPLPPATALAKLLTLPTILADLEAQEDPSKQYVLGRSRAYMAGSQMNYDVSQMYVQLAGKGHFKSEDLVLMTGGGQTFLVTGDIKSGKSTHHIQVRDVTGKMSAQEFKTLSGIDFKIGVPTNLLSVEHHMKNLRPHFKRELLKFTVGGDPNAYSLWDRYPRLTDDGIKELSAKVKYAALPDKGYDPQMFHPRDGSHFQKIAHHSKSVYVFGTTPETQRMLTEGNPKIGETLLAGNALVSALVGGEWQTRIVKLSDITEKGIGIFSTPLDPKGIVAFGNSTDIDDRSGRNFTHWRHVDVNPEDGEVRVNTFLPPSKIGSDFNEVRKATGAYVQDFHVAARDRRRLANNFNGRVAGSLHAADHNPKCDEFNENACDATDQEPGVWQTNLWGIFAGNRRDMAQVEADVTKSIESTKDYFGFGDSGSTG